MQHKTKPIEKFHPSKEERIIEDDGERKRKQKLEDAHARGNPKFDKNIIKGYN